MRENNLRMLYELCYFKMMYLVFKSKFTSLDTIIFISVLCPLENRDVKPCTEDTGQKRVTFRRPQRQKNKYALFYSLQTFYHYLKLGSPSLVVPASYQTSRKKSPYK